MVIEETPRRQEVRRILESLLDGSLTVDQAVSAICGVGPGETNEYDHTDEQSVVCYEGRVVFDNALDGELVITLPEGPLGHICRKSLDALRSGVDVSILDLPTSEGLSVDAVIVEPHIKPLYGKMPKRHLYVVGGSHMHGLDEA